MEVALAAFWERVTARYPEVRSGDLDPMLTHRLSVLAAEAVESWVAGNREWLAVEATVEDDGEGHAVATVHIGPEVVVNVYESRATPRLQMVEVHAPYGEDVAVTLNGDDLFRGTIPR